MSLFPSIGIGSRRAANQQALSDYSEAHLMALSQQGNVSHGQLLEQQAAQTAMKEMGEEHSIEMPKVNFYPSTHSNPRKARRQDIKQAYRLLKPTKRSRFSIRRLWIGGKYLFDHEAHRCVVDGCDVRQLIEHNNLYQTITDEDTGYSLWDMYWKNPLTGEIEAFVAREYVTSGKRMRATYCPEHLHLYHLLCKWENEEREEDVDSPEGLKHKLKRGVSTVAVPIGVMKRKNASNVPLFLEKYEPFFIEIEKDARHTKGIAINHYSNPETGVNDLTMVTFDLRIFQRELAALEGSRPMAPQFSQMLASQQTNMAPPAAMDNTLNLTQQSEIAEGDSEDES
tara:strand:- start:1181 stop:2200 length:1020 start_codon:yes stop_codon:yes gene_type:complete